METKAVIRKEMKKRRQLMSKELYENNSSIICERIKQLSCIDEAEVIYLYATANNEVNLDELINYFLRRDKVIAMPRVYGDDMIFHRISSLSDLETGYFDIREPKKDCPIEAGVQKAVMLVPGVAFNEKGFRIGYGKGFYDRYLKMSNSIYTVGVAYEFQLEFEWKPEEFDVPLDLIITEKREVKINDKT